MNKKYSLKILFVFTFFVFFIFNKNVYAQNIYREFSYGMSIDTVKEISGIFREIENDTIYQANYIEQMQVPFTAVMKKMYNRSVDPMQYRPLGSRYLLWYTGRIGTNLNYTVLDYAFDNNRLVAVKPSFSDEMAVLSELNSRYGKGNYYKFSINILSGNIAYYETYLWNDENRYIIWYVSKINNVLEAQKGIIYINKNWIERICNDTEKLIVERAKSVID